MSEEKIRSMQQSLVDYMKKEGTLQTEQVAQAFMRVPRHLFVPDAPLEKVYSDQVIKVKQNEEGQWTSASSQPAIMAIMLEQLELQPGMNVLEIGAGTGFNAALIASIVGPAGQVVTVDIQPDLVEAARQRLDAAGYGQVETVVGDGGYGYAQKAPYDRIILTVSSAVIPPAWREQLAPGGRLVLPLNIGGVQLSVAFERRGDELVSVSSSPCGFMPLQGSFSTPQPYHTQIGPDPNLYVMSQQPLAVSGDQLAAWLDASNDPGAAPRRIDSGLQMTFAMLFDSLFPWLTIRLPAWGQLFAEGPLAAQDNIPALGIFAGDAEWRTRATVLLAQADGAALLQRPPGQGPQLPPPLDPNNPPPPAPPFGVYIRAIGPESSAAEWLREELLAWDRAGRPSASRLSIRGLPAAAPYQPQPAEFLLDRPYTKFIIGYT